MSIAIQGGSANMQGSQSGGSNGDLINEDFTTATDPPAGWLAVNNSHVTGQEMVSITASGSEDYLQEATAAVADVWAEFKVKIDVGATLSTTNTNNRLYRLFTGGGSTRLAFSIFDDGGTPTFVITDRRNAGDTITVISGKLPNLGVFQRIVIHWKIETASAAGDSVLEIWIDGVKVVDLSGFVSDTVTSPSLHQFGNESTGVGSSYTSRIDDILVGTDGAAPS